VAAESDTAAMMRNKMATLRRIRVDGMRFMEVPPGEAAVFSRTFRVRWGLGADNRGGILCVVEGTCTEVQVECMGVSDARGS
jgi:hypothetical protein